MSDSDRAARIEVLVAEVRQNGDGNAPMLGAYRVKHGESSMRKIIALLVGSLVIVTPNLFAEVLLEAASQNFGPSKPTTTPAVTESQPAAPAQPKVETKSQPAAPVQPVAKPTAKSQPKVEPVAPASPAPPTEAELSAREEEIRRQEAQVAAQRLIDQGQKLYYEGKYADAVAKLEEAVKILPRAKATEIDYNRALHGLTDSYYRLADAAYREGKSDEAMKLAKKALEYDQNNRSAENIIVKLKQEAVHETELKSHPLPPPEEVRLDQTPEFLAKKEEIKKLFRESKILLNSGQYDLAEAKTQEILLIDKYNEDARRRLDEIFKAKLHYAEEASVLARTWAMYNVSDGWIPKFGRRVTPPEQALKTTIADTSTAKLSLVKKLNDIIIPEINFRDAVIADVISFLSTESRKLDKNGTGVNIVMSASLAGGAPTPAPPALPPTPEAAAGGEPVPAATEPPATAGGARKITLSLKNVPMIDALKYVTSLAGLKYRIEPSAVLILPLNEPEQDLVVRTYPVLPGVIGEEISKSKEGATKRSGGEEFTDLGAGGAGKTIGDYQDVKALFESMGVQFPAGSSIAYNERTSMIIVRNTPENLENFETALAAINAVPSQVEIETKFMDISQRDLDEIGFKWFVAPYNSGDYRFTSGPAGSPSSPGATLPSGEASGGSLRDSSSIGLNALDSLLGGTGVGAVGQVAAIQGILTQPQFTVIIKALSQKGSTDLLSAPKITTISGAQAQIRIVQEFIYPTEFDPPEIVAAGGGTVGGSSSAITSSTPSAFKTREIGVLLNVTPTVGPDGYTINLTLIPEVSEFLGFINYGGPIAVGTGDNIVTVQNDIKQPLFASRNLTTSVIIWDNQTVVLGGLIREDVSSVDDKIPFFGDLPVIGRLWRSKTTVRSKRNLMIFVHAKLVDPAGNPIHPEGIVGQLPAVQPPPTNQAPPPDATN